MGGVTQELGSLLGGGPNNSQTTAQRADIHTPVNQEQLDKGYERAQNGLSAQDVLAHQLSGQGGLGNQNNVFLQQQQLANVLQNQAQGQGPNPAQAALNQATGQNVSNQAALMGSQRGAGQNIGLMARQAANQGANIQQQAVGQGATMQAQQQLAAQQQLMQQQGAMQNVAGQQISNQMAGANAYSAAAQQNQNAMLGGIGNYNNAVTANTASMNAGNMAMAQTNANNSAGFVGGLLKGGASAMMAQGGQVSPKLAQVPVSERYPDHIGHMATIYHHGYADGGEIFTSPNDTQGNYSAIGNQSQLNQDSGGGKSKTPTDNFSKLTQGAPESGGAANLSDFSMVANKGGKVSAIVSPGEAYVPPEKVKAVVTKKESVNEAGEKIPGKAKVKGDSLKNDTVPKKLEEGGFVIPRSIMQSDDPVNNAAQFIAKELQKKNSSAGGEHEDFKQALTRAISSRGKK